MSGEYVGDELDVDAARVDGSCSFLNVHSWQTSDTLANAGNNVLLSIYEKWHTKPLIHINKKINRPKHLALWNAFFYRRSR